MNADKVFAAQRPRLFSIAYRMLGSVMDAEDVVQDAFVRWQQIARRGVAVESPGAYLATLVSRRCIDQLRSARARREQYIGPWLPEPLLVDELDPAERVSRADSLSLAFLVVLESLSPAERAAFLLREVFDYEYPEVAGMIGKSEASCRQLVSRARARLAARRPRFAATPEQHRRLADEFARACSKGDLDGLVHLLSEDVTVWTDGGGKVTAARQPVHGPERVARFLLGLIAKAPPDYAFRPAVVNGRAGFVGYLGGAPFNVVALDVADEKIQGIYAVVNPDKLRRLTPEVGTPKECR